MKTISIRRFHISIGIATAKHFARTRASTRLEICIKRIQSSWIRRPTRSTHAPVHLSLLTVHWCLECENFPLNPHETWRRWAFKNSSLWLCENVLRAIKFRVETRSERQTMPSAYLRLRRVVSAKRATSRACISRLSGNRRQAPKIMPFIAFLRSLTWIVIFTMFSFRLYWNHGFRQGDSCGAKCRDCKTTHTRKSIAAKGIRNIANVADRMIKAQ